MLKKQCKMSNGMYLLFDIGGTKMRVAVSRDLQKIEKLEVVATPKNFQDGMNVFQKIARDLLKGEEVKMICGGVAGVLNKNKTKIVNSPNISGWANGALKKNIENEFGAPVYIENDADLAGLGEAIFGAGKGNGIVAYLTISTGIGGTRIVDGRIDKSAMGFEPGHQFVFCSFMKNVKMTTMENCISGTAFSERYKKHPREISDKKIWNKAAEVLAYGLNNTIIHWSPDIIVLGGSMMKKVGISVPMVEFYLKDVLKIFPKIPLIKKAKLGDFGGLYGAMALLNEK